MGEVSKAPKLILNINDGPKLIDEINDDFKLILSVPIRIIDYFQ